MINRLNEVYRKMLDDESRMIFDARLEYAFRRDELKYVKCLNDYYKDWIPVNNIGEPGEYDMILCGAGRDGEISRSLLNSWGYRITSFADKDKKKKIEGIPVLTYEEAYRKFPFGKYIIASRKYGKEIRNGLIALGVDDNQIVHSKWGYVSAKRGNQYFDVFAPRKNEWFIDAGVFDGDSIVGFVDWTGGYYLGITGFEPMPEAYSKANSKFENNLRINIYNYATWDQEGCLNFTFDDAGSYQNKGGKIKVLGKPIDMFLDEITLNMFGGGGEKPNIYLKMDIEGSELRAMKGARKLISTYHPRMAICVYHKVNDFIEIPAFILDIDGNYEFYMRQYFSNMAETVLYAVYKDETSI